MRKVNEAGGFPTQRDGDLVKKRADFRVRHVGEAGEAEGSQKEGVGAAEGPSL